MKRPIGMPSATRLGLVRKAVTAWAEQWASDARPGGLTLPELADHVPGVHIGAPSERALLEATVRDMVVAGDLVRLGFVRRPGQRGRPLRVYAPAPVAAGGQAGAASLLLGVAAGWARAGASSSVGDPDES